MTLSHATGNGISQAAMAMLPVNADGRLYHLGLKAGELAPRILTVGDWCRAKRIAEAFLKDVDVAHQSERGFSTWTGIFEGTRVSIVAIGMGISMMDFFVREARTIVDGPMAIIRFGTCGTLVPEESIGTLCVSTSSLFVSRIPNYFIQKSHPSSGSSQKLGPYEISMEETADEKLTQHLLSSLNKIDNVHVSQGLNASADSFYSSQGRSSAYFDDENESLINMLEKKSVHTLEMETFQLFHLAKSCNKKNGCGIAAGAVAMIVANRHQNTFAFCDERKAQLELEAGKAILAALSSITL